MKEANKEVYFLDTNIFLRFLVKEDEKSFLACKSYINAIEENKVKAVTQTLVITEIQWVLTSFYKLLKKDIVVNTRDGPDRDCHNALKMK